MGSTPIGHPTTTRHFEAGKGNPMPQAERVADILAGRPAVGARATVQGWIRTRRDSKAGLSFLHIHDGSCFAALQVVAPATLANYHDEIARLTSGCAVTVSGTLVASQGKGQDVELVADAVDVVGWVDDPDSYPIQPKHHTFEHLREVAHLRVRTNSIGAVARVRHSLAMALHRYFDEHGFFWVHTPILTASDAEGAGELFRVSTLDLANLPRTPDGAVDYSQDFFGKPAYLTVSGQLNIEAYCLALTRVYTFGPTFRAENSNTSRHLSEFWMVEPEIAFADLADNADLAEGLLKYGLPGNPRRACRRHGFLRRADRQRGGAPPRGLRGLGLRAHGVHRGDRRPGALGPIVRVPGQLGRRPAGGARALPVRGVRQAAVVVVNYPRQIKPFYMRLNDDERTVAAMDVLAPGIGEIVGGSQREERLDVLDARIQETGLDPAAYWWYRDLRRYGTVPHAGFGLGFDRSVAYATGMANVRDVIPFPRTPASADF